MTLETRPRQTTRATFTPHRQAFAWRNGHWQFTPGTYRLGDSSSALPLVARVEVTR